MSDLNNAAGATLDKASVAAYLAARGLGGDWTVTPLGGGVSNSVFLAEGGGRRWVLKQSLEKLRVEEDWFAVRERIHRECAALRALEPVLPPGSVPSVVFEDRPSCIYAMEAAPASACDWKALLLSGDVRPAVASTTGKMLAAMAAVSRAGGSWREDFGSQTCFDQLRLDPYYRFTAARHPDLAAAFDAAIAAARRPLALVHGDFSPKNLLVWDGSVTLIDLEVVHFGDPAFDAAFLLNHLLLKAAHRPGWRESYLEAARAFWTEVRNSVEEPATILHLGCLHLARVDGKSPAEYLDTETRVRVREAARNWIMRRPASIELLLTHAYHP